MLGGYGDPRREQKGQKRRNLQPTNTLTSNVTSSRVTKNAEKEAEIEDCKPDNGLSASESDEDGLIDLSLLSSSPAKESRAAGSGVAIDGLTAKKGAGNGIPPIGAIGLSSSGSSHPRQDQGPLPESLSAGPDTTNETDLTSMPDLMRSLQRKTEQGCVLVAKRFENYGIPAPITSKRALARRVERHMAQAKAVLETRAGSRFYQEARRLLSVSLHDSMTQKEKLVVDWDTFTGGYYGLKRQLFIGNMIASELQKELQSTRSREVSYWTTRGFSSFVLANEVIVSMIAEDFGCSRERAAEIAAETVEFGKAVADTAAVVDDLEVGELHQEESEQFMRGIRR